MAILSSEIKFYLSGGTSNIYGNQALGGDISTTVASSSVNELFDYVNAVEAESGDSEYRCIYIRNTNGALPLFYTKVWIATNTPSAYTDVTIGLGTAAIGATEQTIANESTAPTAVTFSSAASEAQSLYIGDIPSGSYKAVWIKRTVSATTTGYNNDRVILTFKGGTEV